MSVENFSLKLSTEEQANFIAAGEGPYVAYIVGPGSFYLNSLTELYPQITFVTSDDLWTRKKNVPPKDEEAVREWTLEKMVARDAAAIEAVKRHYGCEKVALFGFSAPGGTLGTMQVLNKKSNDISCYVGSGIGLSKLDPSFSATTAAFNQNASLARQQRFKDANVNFEKLKNDMGGIPLPNTNFFIADEKVNNSSVVTSFSHHKRTLTPNSEWVEQTRTLGPKILNKDDEKTVENIIDKHWRYNPNSDVMDEQMRQHFFMKIQPQVDTAAALRAIPQIPVLLIQGKHDFVTPLDEEVENSLTGRPNIKLEKYSDSAHMTYLEEPARYASDVGSFVAQHTPKKTITHTAILLFKHDRLSNPGPHPAKRKAPLGSYVSKKFSFWAEEQSDNLPKSASAESFSSANPTCNNPGTDDLDKSNGSETLPKDASFSTK